MDSEKNATATEIAIEGNYSLLGDPSAKLEIDQPKDFTVNFFRLGKQYILHVPWDQFGLLPNVLNDFLRSKGIDSTLEVKEIAETYVAPGKEPE